MWTYLLGPILTLLPSRWRAEHLADAPVHAAFVEGNPPGFFATVYGEMRKKFAK